MARLSSPILRAKESMGYLTARQRPCCGNCEFVIEAAPTGAYNDAWPVNCTKGGFGTTKQAVCRQHQPKA